MLSLSFSSYLLLIQRPKICLSSEMFLNFLFHFTTVGSNYIYFYKKIKYPTDDLPNRGIYFKVSCQISVQIKPNGTIKTVEKSKKIYQSDFRVLR